MSFIKFDNVFLCRSFLLEDRCRFLSNFSLATAEVELPGEYLVPKVREEDGDGCVEKVGQSVWRRWGKSDCRGRVLCNLMKHLNR